MDYRVTIRQSEWCEREIDAVYAIDDFGRCLELIDGDNDDRADSCGEASGGPFCGESSSYDPIPCNGRHRVLFGLARKHFERFMLDPEPSATLKLLAVKRENNTNTAQYSCGEACLASFNDYDSDGALDEISFRINLYTISFAGELPEQAKAMFRGALTAALRRILPPEFLDGTGDAAGGEARISLSSLLAFYAGTNPEYDTMELAGDPIRIQSGVTALEGSTGEGSSKTFSGLLVDDLGVVDSPSGG